VPAAGIVTVSLIAPLPLAVHDAPADATQLHDVNVAFAGSGSVNRAPTTLALTAALATTIVYVVVEPATTCVAPSVFVTDRFARPVDASVAATGSMFDTPCADVSAPAATWLMRFPAAVARTVTWIVQIAFAATLLPEIATVPLPATAVTPAGEQPVPENDAAGVVCTTIPVGRRSDSATPVSAMAPGALFRMRKRITESR
jgi:hypothetical protein